MIDHVTLQIADFGRSASFYDRALAPLRIKRLFDEGQAAGFGTNRPFFWIHQAEPVAAQGLLSRAHIAFAAENRAEVDAFYQAALAAGGVDHGAPGVRAHYHANYYGAFILDPDGNNVEAVCHSAPQ